MIGRGTGSSLFELKSQMLRRKVAGTIDGMTLGTWFPYRGRNIGDRGGRGEARVACAGDVRVAVLKRGGCEAGEMVFRGGSSCMQLYGVCGTCELGF